jgi:hypothetical protein
MDAVDARMLCIILDIQTHMAVQKAKQDAMKGQSMLPEGVVFKEPPKEAQP